jgi:hypothetical protein
LKGTKQIFEVHSDHQNLQYFWKPQHINYCQVRWITDMADYHFTLHHLPRKQNVKPDHLSWWPRHTPEDGHNESITLLKEDLFNKEICKMLNASYMDTKSWIKA